MAQKQQTIEEQAPTVEEAVNAGLIKLGLSEEWVDVEIVDEGRRGLLGIGGREAIVRLHVRTQPQTEEPQPDMVPVDIPQATAEPVPEAEEAAQATAVQDPEPETLEEPVVSEKTPGVDQAKETAVAVEVVESLLANMDVVASVEATLTPPDDLTGRQMTVLNISGDDLGLLIGARGETLDALQHLSRLMVGHQIRQRANFVIDVEGYRERREQALARMAERMGKKAIDRGTPVTLEPMPAYERRIIHMTLREDPQVRTESTGEGDRRRVRIYPE